MTLVLKAGEWNDTGKKKRHDVLKDQQLNVGVKGCMFACTLKGGGDIAYMNGHSSSWTNRRTPCSLVSCF